MALIETLFSEYPDGAPADWTDFWSTGDITAVVESNAAGDIDFGTKWLKYTATGASISALTWDDLGSMSDACIVAKVRPTSVIQNGGIRFFLRVGGTSADEDAYLFRLTSSNILIQKYKDGASSNLVFVDFRLEQDIDYWIKFQAIGTALKAKVWAADAIEPGEWHLETTDSDVASGAIGAGAVDNGQEFAVDYIGVDSSEINMPVAYTDDVYFSATHISALLDSSAFFDMSIAMGGQFSGANRKLKGVGIYCKTTHDDQVRIAVYSGGVLATGPQGATLLKDFGLTSGAAVDQWIDITTTDDIDIPDATPLWVVIKGDNAAGFKFLYSIRAGQCGDFQVSRGRCYVLSIIGKDPDVAFASTFPAGSASFGAHWYDFRALTEEVSGETTSIIDLHTEIAASSTPVFYDLTNEIAANGESYFDLITEIAADTNTRFFDLHTEISAIQYNFLDLTTEISCATTGFQDLVSEIQASEYSVQFLKTEIAAVWSKYWLQTEIEAYSVARFSYYTEWNPNRFLPVEVEAKKPYSFSFTVNKGLSNVATSPETELLIPGYSWPLRTLFLDYLRIGDSNEYSLSIWWARGHTGKNPLKNVKIKAEYINTNFQNGYEVVTCNWLSYRIGTGDYQTINETPSLLGNLPCDSKLDITLKVDSRDCSLTRGLVFFRLVFTGDFRESVFSVPVYRDGSQYFCGSQDDYTSPNFICRLYVVG